MSKIVVISSDELKSLIQEAVSSVLPKEIKENIPDLINIETAVKILAEAGLPYSKSKIYKLTSSGKLPHKKHGNKLVFSKKTLLAWVEAQLVDVNTDDGIIEIVKSANGKR